MKEKLYNCQCRRWVDRRFRCVRDHSHSGRCYHFFIEIIHAINRYHLQWKWRITDLYVLSFVSMLFQLQKTERRNRLLWKSMAGCDFRIDLHFYRIPCTDKMPKNEKRMPSPDDFVFYLCLASHLLLPYAINSELFIKYYFRIIINDAGYFQWPDC